MKRFHIITLMIGSFVIISLNSCQKPNPPKATVTVTYNNKYQAGATVVVRADPNTSTEHGDVGHVRPDLREDGLLLQSITDGSGAVNFDFKYEAILRVYAYIVPSKNDTIWGEGALILKEDETYNETVILRYQIITP
jgi:hypothetical protein